MTDDTKRLIAELEAAYDLEEGFLGVLRGGHFDSLTRDRFLRLLQSIDLEPADTIDRRLVGLLWYVPLCAPRHPDKGRRHPDKGRCRSSRKNWR